MVQVLEAVAETEAPLLPYGELLAGAVCEEPQAERAERVKAVAAAKAELAAASERASAAVLPTQAVPASMQSFSVMRCISLALCQKNTSEHSEDLCSQTSIRSNL